MSKPSRASVVNGLLPPGPVPQGAFPRAPRGDIAPLRSTAAVAVVSLLALTLADGPRHLTPQATAEPASGLHCLTTLASFSSGHLESEQSVRVLKGRPGKAVACAEAEGEKGEGGRQRVPKTRGKQTQKAALAPSGLFWFLMPVPVWTGVGLFPVQIPKVPLYPRFSPLRWLKMSCTLQSADPGLRKTLSPHLSGGSSVSPPPGSPESHCSLVTPSGCQLHTHWPCDLGHMT